MISSSSFSFSSFRQLHFCGVNLIFFLTIYYQAFPAFNKRYGFIDRDLVNGSILIFEVEAHFPTLQFGGGGCVLLLLAFPSEVLRLYMVFCVSIIFIA